MRQFLVAAAPPGAVLEIDGPDYHYLARVLRLGRGAVIAVTDAAGRRARATVTEVGAGTLRLLVDAGRPAAAQPSATDQGQAVPGVGRGRAGAAAGAGANTVRRREVGPRVEAAIPANDGRRAQATGRAPTTPASATDKGRGATGDDAGRRCDMTPGGSTASVGEAAPGGGDAPAGSARSGGGDATFVGEAAVPGGGRQNAPAAATGPPADAGPAGEPAAPAAPGLVTLVQALPRGALMDRVVRQATELGVARIVPVVAERTQGRADRAAQARRAERWQRIARQAAQQSGSAAPVIEPPVPLRSFLERAPAGGLRLLFHPGAALLRAGVAPGAPAAPGSPAPRDRSADRAPATAPAAAPDQVPAAPPAAQADPRRAAPAGSPAGVEAAPPWAACCAVGPEGGFSPAEETLFDDHGFHPVGLAGGLLRVDTAVVAAVTATRQYLASLAAP